MSLAATKKGENRKELMVIVLGCGEMATITAQLTMPNQTIK